MGKFCKNFIYSLIIVFFTGMGTVYAQPSPAPPPVGLVPWGPTELFLLMLMGYGVRKLFKNKK